MSFSMLVHRQARSAIDRGRPRRTFAAQTNSITSCGPPSKQSTEKALSAGGKICGDILAHQTAGCIDIGARSRAAWIAEGNGRAQVRRTQDFLALRYNPQQWRR